MSDELTERDYEVMLDTFRTASEWHGGQWSALYSYSSTGAIHGEEHQADLLREIDWCRVRAETRSDITDLDQDALEHLRYTVECWPDEAI
jgi:hypothetical protein